MEAGPRNSLRLPGQFLLVVLGTAAAIFLFYSHRPQGTLWIDFAEYWAAARLFLDGRNPYDSALMAELQRRLTDAPETVLMWNPPLVLPLTSVFGAMSFPLARAIWLLSSSLLIGILAASAITSSLPGSGLFGGLRRWGVLYAITFPGFFYCLAYAQVSPLLLLGLWWYVQPGEAKEESRTRSFFSGVALALTLIKPQLLYLLYFYLLFGITRKRNALVLAGLTCGGIFLLAVACAISPEVGLQYLHAMKNPPLYWQNPSLGSWMQWLTGMSSSAVRSLPAILSVLGLFVVMQMRRAAGSEGEIWLVVCVSLLCSPYAWTYDMVLMFPAVIWAMGKMEGNPGNSRLRPLVVWGALVANILSFLTPGTGMQYLVWYPAVNLLLVWVAWKKTYSSGFTGKI